MARWQIRTSPSSRDRYSEDGDTLVEVLAALVVLGIAAMALLFGFATSITASAEHRNLASLDSSVRIAANQAIADVQQEAGNTENNPFLCPATSWAPTFDNLTGSYTVAATRTWWNGTTFQTGTCEQYQPQEYTLTVSSGTYSAVVTTVISDPSSPPSPDSVGTPSKLVWLSQSSRPALWHGRQTPISAAQGRRRGQWEQHRQQRPLLGHAEIGPRGTGPPLTTCSGVESYRNRPVLGLQPERGRNLRDHSGRLELERHMPRRRLGHRDICAPAKFVFTSRRVSGTASNSATLGLITVTEEDAFNNPTNVPNDQPQLELDQGRLFPDFRWNKATTQVSISGGASSVSFYYGDTVAGSPSDPGGQPGRSGGPGEGQRRQTIKAGTAAKLAFTSARSAVARRNSATNAFTVSLEGATYGNVTTKTTSTTVTLSVQLGHREVRRHIGQKGPQPTRCRSRQPIVGDRLLRRSDRRHAHLPRAHHR